MIAETVKVSKYGVASIPKRFRRELGIADGKDGILLVEVIQENAHKALKLRLVTSPT